VIFICEESQSTYEAFGATPKAFSFQLASRRAESLTREQNLAQGRRKEPGAFD
jgi:hypothetical protein